MYINRQMRLALLISFSWHLFWMAFVSIVFLPSALKPRQYFSVYFLGSILKKPISIRQVPLKPYLSEQDSLPDKKHFTEFPTEANIDRQSIFYESPYTSLSAERKIFNPDNFIDVDAPVKVEPFVTSFVSAKSPLRREVIFQPTFPDYPEWTRQELRASFAIFKIYISAEGLVEQLICVQASGNPEVDAALARYIGRWRFAPVLGLQGQWQTVKINLSLK